MSTVNSRVISFLRLLFRSRGKALVFILVIFMLAMPAGLGSQPAKAAPVAGDLQGSLRTKCLNAAQVRTIAASSSDNLQFVGTEAGNAIRQPNAVANDASPEQAARAYLGACGALFGIQDALTELVTQRSNILEDGRSVVRFQQQYLGTPVLAGEVIMNMDQEKNILAIVNKTTTVKIESVTPGVDAEAARQVALQAVAKDFQLDEASLTAADLGLWIYEPRLLNPADNDPALLVWRFEVEAGNAPVAELVLIDAQRGGVALKFNQIDAEPMSGDGVANSQSTENFAAPQDDTLLGAPQLSVYTMNHVFDENALPGTPVCTEGNPSPCSSDTDANAAYVYSNATYWYYASLHSRDGIDGAGMRTHSTVHFGSGYQNAFWNGGQMVYGDGFSTALDVVAHELTHGVTQYESSLFYYYQAGAINESLSDVFGEFVEKYYQGDTDWLLGENLPIGAIRDMSNPPAYGDPDKMNSVYYYTGSLDNGGVHTNSGLNNKAAYLMTDGGSFNGYTVTGLGLIKVSKIYYEAATNLLTSGSDYFDLYQALKQACINLSLSSATGITAADCAQVNNAAQAVEMQQGQPFGGFNPNAPICLSPGQVPSHIFNDGFENGAGNFTFGILAGANPWYFLNGNILAHTGNNAVAVDDIGAVSASYISTGNMPIPSGAYLHFDHLFDLETGFDGGVIEYSTNSGASWNDADGMILPGLGRNYTGTISPMSGNPLGGRSAFTGASHGYVGSTYDLSSLAGQTVMFRWVMGTDVSVGDMAWVLDDVGVYTCRTDTRAKYDFDSNGAADVALYRPSSGVWYVKDQFGVQYGANGDIPVSRDYNGDYKSDVAVFRPSSGVWYVKDQFGVQFGTNGDVPVPGDYNGDGKADVAVYRPSTGVWYVKNLFSVGFGGVAGDIPVPGDYNGDGRTDIAIYRNGMWYVKDQFAVGFGGVAGDIPVPADYDGNGTTDIAIYRSGMWYVKDQFAVGFGGVPGDLPVPADYDGNGATDIAIYRSGMWYVKDQFAVGFGGAPGDYPIAAPDTNGDGDPYQ